MKIWAGIERTGNQTGGIPLWSRTRAGGGLVALLTGLVWLLAACGQLPPLPAHFEAESYAPITYQELVVPGAAKLQAGQKIKVPAYFWEYLTYDPDMVRNYLNLLRYHWSWYKLQWFATYGTSDMQSYYDLAALAPSLVKANQPRRLDHIMIYGELTSLGPGLYLRVHRIERIAED